MSYQSAKDRYGEFGLDTESAIARLQTVPFSIHCWQGDDLKGFDGGGADGGIQTTGNYPGRARNFSELKNDFSKALTVIPGKKRINLHASYAIFEGKAPGRNKLTYQHFIPWVEYAKEQGIGIDFNQTVFGHPMIKDGLSVSSPDAETRQYWIDHCICCRDISEEIGKALHQETLCNLWLADGLKDIPADRYTPRKLLKESLDAIFSKELPHVIDSVESKLFGIGLESYTVGSSEFYIAYASQHKKVYPLLDNGHYHPTEIVSEKIPALLCFFDRIALHVTRSVRWDSDHVVLFEDEILEICKELVRCNALEKALIGLDYFDASINRVAAWVIGARNLQKALLSALLQPYDQLSKLQYEGDFTAKMALSEDLKTLPFGEVWQEYCDRQNIPGDGKWYKEIENYEKDVLSKRN